MPRPHAAAAALVTMVLAGCNSAPTRDPDFAAVRPPVPMPTPASPGAIYRPGTGLVLFEDLRARRVGDILTVRLVEQTDASKSAETTTERDTTASITNPTLLGSALQFNAPALLPLASIGNNSLETSLSASSDFDGKGESRQRNSLTGVVAVTVAEVLPNGNLVVQGEKLLSLNQGHEHVRVSGIVRPEDIDADNSVSSSRVANARIVYGGEGSIASANAIGWLARFFISAIMPF